MDRKSMVDINGNVINSGDTVNIIIAGELLYKAIFHYSTSNELSIISELGVKFRKGGKQAYSHHCLTKFIYAIV